MIDYIKTNLADCTGKILVILSKFDEFTRSIPELVGGEEKAGKFRSDFEKQVLGLVAQLTTAQTAFKAEDRDFIENLGIDVGRDPGLLSSLRGSTGDFFSQNQRTVFHDLADCRDRAAVKAPALTAILDEALRNIVPVYSAIGYGYCIVVGTDPKTNEAYDAYIGSLREELHCEAPEVQEPLLTLLDNVIASKTGEGQAKPAKTDAPAAVPVSASGGSGVLAELDGLIGLESLKKDVKDLISFVKVQKLRAERGLETTPVSLHMVFTGNPGTGKTTVARILAQIYREVGVLKTGQLVEVDRAGLVAGYIGQTALKTQAKIEEAMGGILFVDEAYTLAKEGNDFGQEAIDTVLKAMEDHRDEFIVIVAGYDEPMATFINSNPGLKSRFNKFFHFPDYSGDELIAIFRGTLERYEYRMTEDAMALCEQEIRAMEAAKGENFANARDVRNYFEKIIGRQAVRIDAMPLKSNEDVVTIEVEDVVPERNPV